MKKYTAEELVDIMYTHQDPLKFKELRPDLTILLRLLAEKTVGIVNMFEYDKMYDQAERYFIYDTETGKTLAIVHEDYNMNATSIVFYDEGDDDIDIYLLDPDEAEEVM